MNLRRALLKKILMAPALFAAGATATQAAPTRRVTLQESPINGFQYYDGERVLPRLRAGHRLSLRREPDNRYDERAVAVHWRDRKLGYLPRVENTAVTHMMDNGEQLDCVIAEVIPDNFPWNTVRVNVGWMSG